MYSAKRCESPTCLAIYEPSAGNQRFCPSCMLSERRAYWRTYQAKKRGTWKRRLTSLRRVVKLNAELLAEAQAELAHWTRNRNAHSSF